MQTWGEMRGFPVRVEEMTGEPGDVFVMHPAMFHTVAPNALDRVRMALVETFYRG
jgi:ectoine hydroxylase-related dioxygenase (phytanoyl-CoA dioxygenase family)